MSCVIADFEQTGLLPCGVHWAAWAELEARYGLNTHRKKLLSGLRRGILSLRSARCRALYLDGSFVTAKALPTDYDACWEMAGVDIRLVDPVLLDFSNRRAAQKLKYLGEYFPASARAESKHPFRVYLDFFQVDKELGVSKGIVGLKVQECL